jgi:PAS domain S-box-containing protein
VVVGSDRPVDVLCVDDEPGFAELIADVLSAADARIRADAETDPVAALDEIDDTVDCVVSDYRMPGMTGLELLERVRELRPELPFVLFTGEGSEAVAADAIAAGVTEYVPKTAGDGTDVLVERVLDAIERRRTRAQLERARETQRALVEAAPVPMWVQGVEEIYFANDAAATFFGTDAAADIEGTSALSYVPESDREAVRAENRGMLIDDGSAAALEGYLDGLDGAQRYGIYACATVQFEGRDALLVVARDITDRKEREESLEAENERLAEFASVVSHDVRTPLATASAHLEQARSEAEGPTTHLDAIAAAHDRMDAITADLLRLARHGRTVDEPAPVWLSAVAREAATDAWRDSGTGTARADGSARGGDGEPPTVRVESDGRLSADRGRLTELLSNLLVNARDHGDASTVRVGLLRADEADDGAGPGPPLNAPARDGRYESGFYVEDDGAGVPADERERVFDSGYTTSDTGTGFGLAIVSRVAEAHGWQVSLVAGRDGGARFEFTVGD